MKMKSFLNLLRSRADWPELRFCLQMLFVTFVFSMCAIWFLNWIFPDV